MPEILALGECMVELYAQEPLAQATTFHRSYGGDTLNTLVAASRLGSTTGYLTRVGEDPFAPFLLKSWREEGIDISQVKVVPGFNGLYFIALLSGGEREFTYYRAGSAASTLSPEDLPAAYVASARILHVSGISQAISPSVRAAVLAACRMAAERGVLVSYDPNLRLNLWDLRSAQAALAEVLPYVHILLPSAPEETRQLIGLDTPQQTIEHFWAQGVELVAVKLGSAGCWVGQRETGEMRALAAPSVPVIDTTGAGDAFNGALLHGLAAGLSPLHAAALGVVTASLKVQGRGATASLPSRPQVSRLLQDLAPGWGLPLIRPG